ncbi:enoyl-CoA hydratase/isomerase family protein [Lysinibacillus agricola]|uniref:Enoyl-CoA hydratase/isomerase family protein n=1 Tax=Lysinibacillus agricola TaxID=2590012 RepID=A0ABX7AKI7_9BACI|nr:MULTISPECIES: enoyl-CoA hydratase-related protein [Lysinibacillus]KOS60493.1 enoyl-CoA hydratase [Lysinibacillus sp. FJAT-14222]QQP10288.1 enoyl-CoA hydratase/isomerase family protein [Lysinibacillus agricola]
MIATFANISKEGSITIVNLDHPPANTLSSACIENLRFIFQELSVDEETNAIILTGSGRFFAAGADIKEFVAAFGKQEDALKMAEAGQALCDEIESMKKPVIAAINGPALGGGLELALGCHFRIASDNAILGLPELKLGLLPTFGGTQRLSRITSQAKALQLILTSQQLSADEALQLGIIQMVTEPTELLTTAKAIAQSFIEGKSMTSVSRTIECVIQGMREDFQTGLERERTKFAELFLTDDAKEGVQAFIEKRQPRFKHS